MLISLSCVAHVQFLRNVLMEVVNFQTVDVSESVLAYFPVEVNEPFNAEFANAGYEYSDFILNLGPVFLTLLVLPLIPLLFFATKVCCFKKFIEK